MSDSRHATRMLEPLVRDARDGDEAALTELLTRHLPLLYNIIGRALNGHHDVDDLVQETVLQIIRGLPDLREPDRFRSWAVAIAYRQVQQHVRNRRAGRRLGLEQLADVPDPSADFAERTISELLLTGQRQELVLAARWLDESNRHLLALWWQEAAGELSRAELSGALGLPPTHTAVRLQRMRAQLDTSRVIVRALDANPRCPVLDELAHGWNGRAGALWRKRLNRHVRNCPCCSVHAQGLVPPEKLLLGVSTLALPVMVTAGLHSALDTGVGIIPAAAAPVVTAGHSLLARLIGLLQGKGFAAAAAITLAGGGLTYAVDFAPPPSWDNVTIVNPTPTPSAPQPSTTATPTPSVTAKATPSPTVTPSSKAGKSAPPAWTGVGKADVYVAPGGSDKGDGTLSHPFATLGKAVAAIKPGQAIALRGGTYQLTQPIDISTNGTADRRITLSNYRNERPVLDAAGVSADNWTITHDADYWTVQGLELKNSPTHAYVCLACKYDVFQRLSIHDNVESGLLLRNDGTVGNKVLDSDFYNNHSLTDGGSGGIGLGVKFGFGAGNLLRGNRAFNNADDGFSLSDFHTAVTLEDNWAFGNGVNRWKVAGWHSNGNGFSLGGGSSPVEAAHVLTNNAAWNNINRGFDDQGNTGAIVLRHNTAFRNQGVGFDLPNSAAKLLDDVAIGNGEPVAVGSAGDGSGNSWNGGQWSVASFASTTDTEARGARRADGSLPRTDFLKTAGGAGASLTGTSAG